MWRPSSGILSVSILAAGCMIGCDSPTPTAPSPTHATSAVPAIPPPPVPPPPVAVMPKERSSEEGQSVDAASPPVQRQPPEESVAVPARASAQATLPASWVRLSAAAGLAQTGPRGTLMGFSVDYEFVRGRPNPSAKYLWVIEPENGESKPLVVDLKPEGTAQVLVEQWRPEHGPFTSWIEEVPPDGTRREISDPVDMR